MIAAVIAAVVAAAFHVVPTPSDVTSTVDFTVQGFVSDVDHTLIDDPAFEPETERLRPSAKISFVAPASGMCIVAETETIDGKTTFTVNDRVQATAGERVFRRVVLLTADDLAGDNWQDAVKHRYRFVVACRKDGAFLWSAYYEVPVEATAAT